MSFRNIKPVLPSERDCAHFVVLRDDKFVDVELDVPLPSSNDYSLADLLASGQRVAPVDTTILHDSDATSQVVNTLMNTSDSESSDNSNNE
jgi:hypothetical protein